MDESDREKELIEKVLMKQKALPENLTQEIEEAFEQFKEKSDKKKIF
ncbi:hypothetical protein SAMN04488587_0074 [Methanococcoides vulcani]|uniref:Uncharacterized protein n=1 Tax=Methanococcoides vulcani TaxID=1353158 RepID=A0A1H9Y1E4_9EURY|nr:hypothetical protein [Methanococcoides vulcani]SES62073.1 hypothetical protein SAMN04488587_0074 [Methanococcoides vulcani]